VQLWRLCWPASNAVHQACKQRWTASKRVSGGSVRPDPCSTGTYLSAHSLSFIGVQEITLISEAFCGLPFHAEGLLARGVVERGCTSPPPQRWHLSPGSFALELLVQSITQASQASWDPLLFSGTQQAYPYHTLCLFLL